MVGGMWASGGGSYFFSRQLTPTGWLRGHGSPTVQVTESQPLPAGTQYPPVDGAGKVHPNQCLSKVLGNTWRYLRVGETHRWRGSTASFHYGQSADSDIDVAYHATGGSWSIDGSAHIGNSTGEDLRVPDTKGNYGQHVRSKFHTQRVLEYTVYPGPCIYRGTYLITREWIGGLVQGDHFTNTLDSHCKATGTQYHAILGAGGELNREHMTAFHYGVVGSVFGISIGGQSGFSTNASYHYETVPAQYICGTSGHAPPSQAPNIAIGPRQ